MGIIPVLSVDPGRSEPHQITAITTAISVASCSVAFCSSFLWLKLPFEVSDSNAAENAARGAAEKSVV